MKDMEDTERVEDVGDIEDMEEVEDVEDVEDTEEIEDVRDIEDTEDTEKVGDVKDVGDTEDTLDRPEEYVCIELTSESPLALSSPEDKISKLAVVVDSLRVAGWCSVLVELYRVPVPTSVSLHGWRDSSSLTTSVDSVDGPCCT